MDEVTSPASNDITPDQQIPSATQFNQMMALMQQQMQHITALSTENSALRQNQQMGNASSTKKPDRPVIESGSSDSDWQLFLDTGTRYKRMSRITSLVEVTMELRACCSNNVNKLLFDFVGPVTLNSANEMQLLNHIKSVAVKTIHKEVHRLSFTKIYQAENEPVTNFVARLKAQASLCAFTIPCTGGCGEISYAKEMILHQLIAGLCNHDFQSRILAEAVTLTTLAAKIDHLQTLETTEERS